MGATSVGDKSNFPEAGIAQGLSYESVARSLARGFFCVFYVNMQTNEYVQFIPHEENRELDIERRGHDFFLAVSRGEFWAVYSEDVDMVYTAFSKEHLLHALDVDKSFFLTFRLVIDGKATYIRLKATRRNPDNPSEVFIGLINADAHMQRLAEYEHVRKQNLTFASVAEALASDYVCIYYVNTQTEEYTEYSSNAAYKSLNLSPHGFGIFGDNNHDFFDFIYEEDREMYLTAFTKENVLRVLSEDSSFLLTYRIVLFDKPVYLRIKVTRMVTEDNQHVAVALTNVDSHMRRAAEYAQAQKQSLTFAHIAESLAADYYRIYHVNMETEEFTEYGSHQTYHASNPQTTGERFFTSQRERILHDVCEDDREMMEAALTKESFLSGLEDRQTHTIIFSGLVDGKPTYQSMKVIRVAEDNDHLIVGLSNIDEQVRREQEHQRDLGAAREAANRDPLTGVKSKHAYNEAEKDLKRGIAERKLSHFALVICDVNNLKYINDTFGHKAGDEYIKRACAFICNSFKHSPVYRIGGDEFVAVLSGSDYERRAELLQTANARIEENQRTGGVVIAIGCADFDLCRDHEVAEVFERADVAMYERKRALKQADYRSPKRSNA